MNRSIKKIVVVVAAFITLIAYQNCASQFGDVEFSTVRGILNASNCSIFSGDSANYTSCQDLQSGLVGRLYYMEDRTDGSSLPSYLYSKEGEKLAFNERNFYSANVILEKGFMTNAYILMEDVSIPSTSFSEGFKISENSYLTDRTGKKLVEAFALDLRGKLQLPKYRNAGIYEIAVLSDDGSILDLDLDGRGYKTIVNNDGYHSPRMKCSNQFFSLDHKSQIPLRLRYYQGPRTRLALTIVMRQVDNYSYQVPGSTDSMCDRDIGTNANFELASRGWFVPDKDFYAFPDVYQIADF